MSSTKKNPDQAVPAVVVKSETSSLTSSTLSPNVQQQRWEEFRSNETSRRLKTVVKKEGGQEAAAAAAAAAAAGRASFVAIKNEYRKRKRSDDDDEEEEEEVTFVGKRHRREVEFHRREMDSDLGFAGKYAKEGNRRLMEVRIESAEKHAASAGAPNDAAFRARVSAIRGRLTDERPFHLREMDAALECAGEYAAEGNRRFMEVRINRATRHAANAGVLNDAFRARVAAIRGRLSGERAFHLRKLDSDLDYASKYAREGNRRFMEVRIAGATTHAASAGVLNAVFNLRVAAIRGHLQDERSFHLREMECDLGYAGKYAKEGDRLFMEVRIEGAAVHAGWAGVLNDAFHARVAAIRGQLTGENLASLVKTDCKPKKKSPSKARRVVSTSTSVTAEPLASRAAENGDSTEEVIVEQHKDIHQIVKERVEKATANGDVVDLS
jgi:hypothetical protein